ncbi:MAG: DNA polymerase III subunit alpha [Candidatus Eisenbacteria bacterium]|uniref:DNA-directed DNA polymerase n=1 Tax=Eiseniibacteriota bacterium TaxID=2212470 RepID=A0A948RUT5_UNCEI|nr:DNA polymerase III subunit alpha [Candidatus Eisenbacteria bacterium]
MWGTQSPEQLINRAALERIPGLALTDRDNLYLAVPALKAAAERNVKLLLGAEITRREETSSERKSVVVYALNLDGYGRLCRLITERQTGPDFQIIPSLLRAGLSEVGAGLFVATEDASLLERLAVECPEDRLGALLVRSPGRSRCQESALREAAKRGDLPLLGSVQITVAEPRDLHLHRLLCAIRKKEMVSNITADDQAGAGTVWPSPEEMTELWQDDPGALAGSRDLLERSELTIRDLTSRGPIFPTPPGSSREKSYDQLYRICQVGLNRRYPQITPRVVRRLHRELEIIRELGFIDYFLVVGRIVAEAQRRGIPNVGRGSGAGSIVSYVLGITNVDPIRYRLYFERFLHKLRRDLPDLDIDFCWRRRDEVIRWVYETYGAERVAMISTHNTFHPRSAFREAAKALGVPHGVVNRLCRSIPRCFFSSDDEPSAAPPPAPQSAAPPRSLIEMVRAGPLGHRVPLDDPPFPEIFALAERLLGMPRHLGLHPGGIVISDHVPLAHYVPLQPAAKGIIVTQFEMRAIEEVGLVKIDLLGNRALSTIAETEEILLGGGQKLNWDAIPHDDPNTGRILSMGQSLGCFQLESPGMRQLLVMTNAKNLEGALHALALIRPGPSGSGMKEAFIRRVRGEEPVSVRHPRLESLLLSTHGVMLYEEDVMSVAACIGGFSLALGDLLRRAIAVARAGEKGDEPAGEDPWTGRTLKGLEDGFLQRAVNQGIPVQIAREVWKDLTRFAAYAFCRAHAAGYAVLAYRSAYLKAHFPGPFTAALFNNHQGMYPLRSHVEEARRCGLLIRPPCIHRSEEGWKWETDALRCGLNRIHRLTETMRGRILEERRKEPFRSLGDLWSRVPATFPEIEALVRIGALETVPPGDRRSHLWELYRLARRTRSSHAAAATAAPTLSLPPPKSVAVMTEMAPPSLWERLCDEMEILDMALSGHPIEVLRRMGALADALAKALSAARGNGRGAFRGGRPGRLDDSRDIPKGGRCTMAGWIAAMRRVQTSHGDPMLFVTLDDEFGLVESVVWPGLYHEAVRALGAGRLWLVSGIVKERYGAYTLEMDAIHPMHELSKALHRTDPMKAN